MRKTSNLEYKIQEYLLEGNKNTETSKVIFKARGQTLEIKTQKQWKYNDILCVGCGVESESVKEILTCNGFGEINEKITRQLSNLVFSGDSVSCMVEVANELKKG